MLFYDAKGHLLPCKRASFTVQYMPFYYSKKHHLETNCEKT